MLPDKMSVSNRRCTICSEVNPSGYGDLMLHHFAIDDCIDHVMPRLACLGN